MLAEDEVNGSFDVAFCVDLVSGLSKKSVLVSVQADAVVSLLSIVGCESDGLGSFAVGVLDVDVVEFGVCCAVLDGSGCFVVGGPREET